MCPCTAEGQEGGGWPSTGCRWLPLAHAAVGRGVLSPGCFSPCLSRIGTDPGLAAALYQPRSYHCNGAGSTWGFQAPVEVSVCLETQASDEVLLFLRNRSGTDGKTSATSKPAAGSWSAPVPVVALSRWCSPSLVLAPARCCLRITPSLCNFCFTF